VTRTKDKTYSSIVVDTRDNLEVVTLNRPHVLNAFNPAMVGEILDYFAELHERPEIRVVLLRGAGRAVCAGLDL
jgi:enoyl-CoA hydratase/carnithine racemase